jgi:hypothetical protein
VWRCIGEYWQKVIHLHDDYCCSLSAAIDLKRGEPVTAVTCLFVCTKTHVFILSQLLDRSGCGRIGGMQKQLRWQFGLALHLTCCWQQHHSHDPLRTSNSYPSITPSTFVGQAITRWVVDALDHFPRQRRTLAELISQATVRHSIIRLKPMLGPFVCTDASSAQPLV